MKQLTVLRGPCGAGKTFLAERLYGASRIDMADCPNNSSYDQRIDWLRTKLTTWPYDTCVLEGIFAPGSPSWRWLKQYCQSKQIELVSIIVMRPLDACAASIPPGDTVRHKFLKDYWFQFSQSY